MNATAIHIVVELLPPSHVMRAIKISDVNCMAQHVAANTYIEDTDDNKRPPESPSIFIL